MGIVRDGPPPALPGSREGAVKAAHAVLTLDRIGSRLLFLEPRGGVLDVEVPAGPTGVVLRPRTERMPGPG